MALSQLRFWLWSSRAALTYVYVCLGSEEDVLAGRDGDELASDTFDAEELERLALEALADHEPALRSAGARPSAVLRRDPSGLGHSHAPRDSSRRSWHAHSD